MRSVLFLFPILLSALSEFEVREHLLTEAYSLSHFERVEKSKTYADKLILVRHAAARLHMSSQDKARSAYLYAVLVRVIVISEDFYRTLNASTRRRDSVYAYVGFMMEVWRSYQILEKISECVICLEDPCMMRYSEHGL